MVDIGLGYAKNFHNLTKEELLEKLSVPTSERQFIMYEALRKGATVDEIFELTQIKHYFIEQMKELVEEEEEILAYKGKELPLDVLKQAKQNGFSDKYLSQLLNVDENIIRKQRLEHDIFINLGNQFMSVVQKIVHITIQHIMQKIIVIYILINKRS